VGYVDVYDYIEDTGGNKMAEAVKKAGKRVIDHAAHDVEREVELRTLPLKHEIDEAGKVLVGAFDQAKQTLSRGYSHEGMEDLATELSNVLRDEPWLGAMVAAGSGLIVGALVLLRQKRMERRQHWRRRAQRMAQQAQQTARRELSHAQERAEELSGRVSETVAGRGTTLGAVAMALAVIGVAMRLMNRRKHTS
jgi:ElaB/YqjD/DUF883 family membrane-anchored ribosome-binding protein